MAFYHEQKKKSSFDAADVMTSSTAKPVGKTFSVMNLLQGAMTSKPGARASTGRSEFMTIVLVTLWYMFSASATFTNKVLVKQHHVAGEMLNLSHLFISLLLDFTMLTFPTTRSSAAPWRMQYISMKTLLWFVPLSMFSVLAKVFTYWSYGTVPVSITHTCKASQPFFNVLLAYTAYNQKFSWTTYLTLLPIVAGVTLASISEIGMNNMAIGGTVFAVTSALLGVMQSMYAKFLLRKGIVGDSVNLHFYNALISFAINAPLAVWSNSTASSSTQFTEELTTQTFPYLMCIVCSLMSFVGSFCSTIVLGDVSELTFSIMSTMKRVVVILGAVVYFGNPVTFQSVSGMLLAISGVGAYQIMNMKSRSKDAQTLPHTVRDVEKDKLAV